jgi:cytochrome c biogenesis protein CcmG/thiol:disulfide interchange protein DsbE
MSSTAPESGRPKRGLGRYVFALIPLVVFGGIAATAAKMLYDQQVHGKDISEIPSALIGTRAPSLDLPPLEGANLPALTDSVVKGKLTLVNVFASWCIPCRDERFLSELGNPYAAIGIDPKGRAAIDWGVYGIPESYLVGPDGTILYKRVGPFDDISLKEGLFPAMEKALGKPVS